MTRPDVAALATALREVGLLPEDDAHEFCDEDSGGNHRFDTEAWAEAIIAALAAAGWRITSAPEDAGSVPLAVVNPQPLTSATADDPVSAQAAPDMPPTKRIGDYSVLVDGLPDRVAQAAVRAAIQRTAERIERLAPYGPMVDVSEVLNLLRMEVPDGE